jgi:hypothetical protein
MGFRPRFLYGGGEGATIARGGFRLEGREAAMLLCFCPQGSGREEHH